MDATITYIRKVPFWKIIIGFAAILIGVLGLINFVYFALVPLLFGVMMLKTEGSEINLESKTYRKINSFLGVHFGKWQPLQNPEYISVFNTTEDITVRALSAETTNSFPIIVLNIFYERNKKITVYKTKHVKDAFEVASHIADALMIDLLDATEKGDYKWVDKNILREKGEICYID
ncbi:hypothetical protein [uncultured Psychroserpens sp.]|uniref:hypothetical protein n=1 Tax=uncultured Psychroserpens sp. TaxID=255436 RepID=UPI0026027DB2|nr:hypothetical protein [uncultured Psychroserpens sp.]